MIAGPAGIAISGAIHQGPPAANNTKATTAAAPTKMPPVTHQSRLIAIRTNMSP